jgi:Tfp pilus assembly protein PilV
LIGRRVPRNDDGVSLVETIVALLIAAGVLMALAAATVTSLKSTLVSRQNQQASDIATQLVEKARAMPYGAMTMVTADVPGGDANVTGAVSTGYLANAGTGSAECAAITAGGSLTSHVVTLTRNKTPFTAKTYITYPGVSTGCNTAYASVRRVTVVVTWSTAGKARTRRLSTLVADTVRGLPLPRFTLASSRTVTTSISGPVSLPIRIANLGARDAFELTVSPANPTYVFYVDTNRDGVHQDTETTVLPTSANGKPSTGLLEPSGEPSFIVAYRVADAAESSSTVTITATSVAQSTYPGAVHTITDTISIAGASPAPSPTPTASPTASPSASPSPTPSPTPTPSPITPATCSGACYVRTVWLHNNSAGGATTTQEVMPGNLNMPTQTTLPAYSGGATAGRAVAVGNDQVGTNSSTEVADWRFQIPASSQFKGTARVTLWASADTSSAATSHTLSFAVGTATTNASNNSFTPVTTAAATATNWGTSPRQVIVDIPLANLTIASGQYLVIRVQVAKSSSSAMHLEYDTTTYGAGISLPVVYGLP